MSDRLKAFTVEELHALIFRLDIAATIEPLDESDCGVARGDDQGLEGAGGVK